MRMTPIGSGGSSSKGSVGEVANTARTKSWARILVALGEGQLALADEVPEKSIYFDDVPLEAADGTLNMRGVTWAFNPGLADQDVLPGFSAVESTTTYGAEVKKHIPVVKEIVNPLATSVRVTIRIPAMAKQGKANDEVKGNSVTFLIEVRPFGGAWTSPFGYITIKEKFTSACDFDYRCTLPKNASGVSYPWDVRVTRITNDSNDSNDDGIPDDTQDDMPAVNANQTYVQAITDIVEYPLTYPHTALFGVVLDSLKFGTSVPTIGAKVTRVDGLVPTNYDPVARTYTGIWDGTFKAAANSNTAWAFYDLLANKRFGLGKELSAEALSAVKWDLYEIGRYCDEMVPDGYGGTEPRLTFNGVIKEQKDAYDLLALIASTFRGMTWWSSGAIRAVCDQPTDPVVLVTPSNVIDGSFDYQGTAKKARNTIVRVSWNDPSDLYRTAYEVVEDADGIARYGRRTKDVAGVGITSRGQARRYGLWILATELGETQIVTYRAGFDHGYVSDSHPGVVPGDVVAIADPSISGIDLGGRLLSGSTTTRLVLDRPLTIEAGKTYSATVRLSTGVLASASIIDGAGTVSAVTLSSALTEAPAAGLNWIVTVSDLAPRPFRVISVAEVEKHIYEIKALINDTTKYDRVDNGVHLTPRQYTQIPISVGAARNLAVTETQFVADGVATSRLTVSWSAPAAGVVGTYHVFGVNPSGSFDLGRTASTSVDIDGTTAGDYTFAVAAVTVDGKEGPEVSIDYTAHGWVGLAAPYVTDVVLVGGASSTVFTGRTPKIGWTTVFPDVATTSLSSNPFYDHSTVVVHDATDSAVLRTATVLGDGYAYDWEDNVSDAAALGRGAARTLHFEVSVTDIYGRVSSTVGLTVSNPAPALVYPSIVPTFGGVSVTIPAPSDIDFSGILVWASLTSGFDPTATTPIYDGPNTSVSIPIDSGVFYWLRVAAYDVFGKSGLNISAEVQVSTSGMIDTDGLVPSLGALITDLEGRVSELSSTQLREILARRADRSRAQALSATVRTEVIEYTDGVSESLAARIDTVEATAIGVAASVIDEASARTTAVSAVAESLTEISASINDATADGSIRFVAAADQSGALARYELRAHTALGGGGEEASAALTIEAVSSGTGSVSQVKVAADRFYITSADGTLVSFAVVDGVMFADDLQVRHTLHIGAGGYPGAILISD